MDDTGKPVFAGVINPTQPDGSLDGAAYEFLLGSHAFTDTTGDHVVNNTVIGCTKDGAAAVLDDCLANATFSSYFKFAADRVVIKRS